MYAEDLDLGWRLERAGWATRYVPEARVRHAGAAATIQAWGEERTDRWMRSTYAWMLARRGGAITRAVALINLAGAVVRWAGLRAAAVFAPGRFGGPAARMKRWARLHAIGLSPRIEPERKA